ncbi:hypothetical protein B6U98_05435 [Thermoplasmatales archaeon ex4572_165]|nr:MAG: hypothetical protein B6U98_05435 [Thermoplasmatales archaeon ex4572_165]RLF58362.1 MAG: hypothetical protein DRN27_05630 [Thermoplasmata archaeon]
MIKQKAQALILFLLNDISDKFDAISLKSLVDFLFKISEKIIIHFPKFLPFYIEYYADIIEQEISMINMTDSASILHIGCGSIPASSILLAKKTQAKILGIDLDFHAIKKAKICIKNMGLTKRVVVKQMDALKSDLSSHKIILISQGIIPKEIFMQKLADNLSLDQIIVLRSFSQDKSLDPSDEFLKNSYNILDIFCHKKHGSTTSIVLKKKNKV